MWPLFKNWWTLSLRFVHIDPIGLETTNRHLADQQDLVEVYDLISMAPLPTSRRREFSFSVSFANRILLQA
jgi:hypothetical protein